MEFNRLVERVDSVGLPKGVLAGCRPTMNANRYSL